MKNVLYSFLMLFLFTISYSCKPSEQVVTIINKSGKDLSNVTISSSRFQKHAHKRWRKVRKGGKVYLDYLKDGEELEALFIGNLNSECLTISSDSLNLMLYDCMEEKLIKSENLTLTITSNNINLEY